MEIDRPSKTWSVVGKLAVLVAIVVGILQGLKLIRSEPAARVLATVRFSEFSLPPDLVEQLESFRRLRDSDSAKQFWTAYKPDGYKFFLSDLSRTVDKYLSSSSRSAETRAFDGFSRYVNRTPEAFADFKKDLESGVASLLVDYVSSGWNEQYRFSIPAYSAFYRIEVANTGGRQASNVELTLPEAGIATVETLGRAAAPTRLAGTVGLGTILPQRTVTVRLWTLYSSPSRWGIERWRLSYADGVGRISLVDGD